MKAARYARVPAQRDGGPAPGQPAARHETMTCPVCQALFALAGRQRYCGDRCRQAAFRRRHQDQPVPVPAAGARPSREHTI